MLISIEEYISKRKREDGLNELDPQQRVKNMGMFINYVVEYFDKYINPEKVDINRVQKERKIEKLKKQLRIYDEDIKEWMISIFEKYEKRIDISLNSFIKKDNMNYISYREEDFIKCAEDFYSKNINKMPFLKDNKEKLSSIIKSIIRKDKLTSKELQDYFRLGTGVIHWIKDTYENYSVNILDFAYRYVDDFYEHHVQFEFDREYNKSILKAEYNIKTNNNLFGIDELYEEIKDRPFIRNHKDDLEMIFMHIWLFNLNGDEVYWNTYINKIKKRKCISEVNYPNKLIPVQFMNNQYPDYIHCDMRFINGHFDIDKINTNGRYILSTEYSCCRREFKSKALEHCDDILKSNRKDVPLLWINKQWSKEFVKYIKILTNNTEPEVIEIYPPYRECISSIDEFIEIYKYFDYEIKKHYKNTQILIGNSKTSFLKDWNFLISNVNDIKELCSKIDKYDLDFRISLDITQYLKSYTNQIKLRSMYSLKENILDIKDCVEYIKCIHYEITKL